MGYDGTKYSQDIFSSITTKLQAASDTVEEGPGAPPDPDAGEVTGDVLRALGLLSGGAAKVVEGLSATSGAVTGNRNIYETNERDVTDGINRMR